MDKRRLLEGPLLRPLVSFSLPLVLGMVGHSFFNLVDVFLVSSLGPAAVSGVHFGSVLNFIPMILFNGITVATVAFLSRAAGKDDSPEERRIARRSLSLTVFLGVVLGILGYATAGPAIRWLRAPEEAAPLAETYLEIVSLGTITMFLLLQVTALLRAVGESVWPMVLLVGGNVLNVLLCLVLIFGWGPFPRMGVAGSAWATVISRGVFGLLGLCVLFRRRLLLWGLGSSWRETLSTARKLVALGMPSGAQMLSRVIGVLGISSLVGYFDRLHGGNQATAAYGIGVRLDMLALFGAAGWGAAASTVVGMNLGAGNPARASRAAWGIAGLSAGMMVLVGGLFYSFAEALTHFVGMGPPEDQLRYGVEYLRIIVFSYLFVALGIVLSSSLNGAGSTRLPLLLDFTVFVLLLYPLSSWVVDDYGLPGVWWTCVVLNAALAGAYALCFNRGSWKEKVLHA